MKRLRIEMTMKRDFIGAQKQPADDVAENLLFRNNLVTDKHEKADDK